MLTGAGIFTAQSPSPTSCFPCPSLSSGAAPELFRSHKLPERAENGMPKPRGSPRLAASG